jgi:hypothetical protein
MSERASQLVGKQLELLTLRACEVADHITAGTIGFLDGIDLIYDGACASGLVDAIGDDAIQKLMAACFAEVGREARHEAA